MKTKIKIFIIPIIFSIIIISVMLYEAKGVLNIINNYYYEYDTFTEQGCSGTEAEIIMCESFISEKRHEFDTISAVEWTVRYTRVRELVMFNLPILLLIMSIWVVHSKLKSGYFKNIVIKQNYKKFLLKEFSGAYLFALIVPITLTIIAIMFHININNFDPSNNPIAYWCSYFYNMPIMYISFYIINIFVYSLYIINIGLFFANKKLNKLLTIFAAYVTFYALNLFMDVVISQGLALATQNIIFVDNMSYFALWMYACHNHPLFMFAFSTTLFITSLLVVIKSYSNKEKVVMQSEK